MLSGFFFQYFQFFQNDLLFARDEIQELAFFLVLLIAGLEMRVEHLKWHIFVMAILPVAFEIFGIALYAYFVLQHGRVEGLMLGSVLAALGDGLVIPKMQEFAQSFPKHELPRLVSSWAPVEASFVLTTFGVLAGLASPESGTSSIQGIVLANTWRLVATLFCGVVLGAISARVMNWIKNDRVIGLFSGSSSERLLMLLATTLAAFALGHKRQEGQELVPMGFAPGSTFQPELLVIVTGASFAKLSEPDILHGLEASLREVWTFGQIFLFSMLGSKITPDLLPQLGQLFPLMLSGLLCRFMGVLLGILLTCSSRERTQSVLPDTLFCFLCTLPRATIQGALGPKPNKLHFFGASAICSFIFTAAQLYILCYSVTGMILLHTIGPKLLLWSQDQQPTQRSQQLAGTEEVETGLLQATSDRASMASSQETSKMQSDDSMMSLSTVHVFETYEPRLLEMKGRRETRDSTMLDSSFKPRRGEVVAKAFKPRQIPVPVKSTKSTVEVKDGISIEIPKGKKVGEMYLFNFAPEPDYMLQAPWVPMEKVYNFTNQKTGLPWRIKMPAGHTRRHLVPRPSLMLEIPASSKPGSVVFFKHPDEAVYPNWFNTKLPSNWKGQSRYLPVRLPNAEYEQRFGGSLLQDFQEFLQSLWEECRKLWHWLCCC